MPMDNTLNISEMLRRLGVKGDSKAAAPLLESLRLSLQIGDLSDLVPPVPVPIGGAAIGQNGGVGGFNKWSLTARSPGGLVVNTLQTTTNNTFSLLVGPTLFFGAEIQSSQFPYASGQLVQSFFVTHTTGARVLPNLTMQLRQLPSVMGRSFENYVGPGEHFMIEANNDNITQTIMITWKEFPGAISPG